MLAISQMGHHTYRPIPSQIPGIVHAMSPYCYRCPMGLTYPSCEVKCAQDIQELILTTTSGFPAAFISAFFTGAILIETVFSLDGLGLLGFESAIKRDYAVVFATLYIFALLGLVVNILSDFVYTLVDPRIDFESREV